MLLILREEVLCAIILLFLQVYYAVNKVQSSNALFPKIAIIAFLHVLLDGITVITVNNMDVVPDIVNRLLHIAFYITGVLFGKMLYNHVLNLCGFYRFIARLKNAGYVLLIAFSALLFFLPMEYVDGTYTNYSYGPLAIIGYALFLFYCGASLILLLCSYQKLDRRTRVVMIPILSTLVIAVIAQAICTELLITGASVTLVTLGLFVSLDNPDRGYMEQALWDYATGLKNRNSCERELKQAFVLALSRKKATRAGFLVADINDLKLINDTCGHQEGDRLISTAADILRTHLKTAENIYRMGGDEFLAVYYSPDDIVVAAEIKNVVQACRDTNQFTVPLSMAIGYTSGVMDGGTDALVKAADQAMYKNKAAIKSATEYKNV